MFRQYQRVHCCFDCLEDVSHNGPHHVPAGDKIEASRWFNRGWTHQELLAPQDDRFFRNWRCPRSKKRPAPRLSKRIGIDYHFLFHGELPSASAAQKMSLATERHTTRLEDIGYYLLGIFDISISMGHGEGENAFIRLQKEILEEYHVHSIFAWAVSIVPKSVPRMASFVSHPRFIKNCSDFILDE